MSRRFMKSIGALTPFKGFVLTTLTAVGILAALCILPNFSHKVEAAGCIQGLKVDTQYSTGTCIGEIDSGQFVDDYIMFVVDVAGNGVNPPTDLNITLSGKPGLTGNQDFSFPANASTKNEYVSVPGPNNQYGNVGVSLPMTKNCTAGGNNTNSVVISATSAGSNETQSQTINYCDIQAATQVHGSYYYTVKLTFAKAPQTGTDSQCSAGPLGYAICPLIDFLTGTMTFLQNNFILPYLAVPPLTIGDPNDSIFRLWDTMRNLANVIMVVLFFIVIFSQATSIGVSRYGIKRMLPRLLTAAILANISYYLLAFIIDAFNLFGAGFSQFVTGIITSASNGTGGSSSNPASIFLIVTVALTAVFFTGGLASPIVSWILSLIGAAFLILLAAVAVLVIRQMLIIVLVITSPILLVLRAIEDA